MSSCEQEQNTHDQRFSPLTDIDQNTYKNYFRQFLSNAPDLCYLLSSKGIIVDINNTAIEILGKNKQDILGKQIIPTVYPDAVQRAQELVNKWRQSGFLRNEEITITTKNGKRNVLLSVNDLKNIDGKILYSILIQKDITEIKKATNETEWILNASANGIRIVSKDFTVKKVNDTITTLAEISHDDAVGMKCSEMFGSDRCCGTNECSLVNALKTGEKFATEDIRKTRNGTKVHCLVTVTPIKDDAGEITGIIEDFQDITQIKERERKLFESEQKFHSLYTSMTEGVVYQNADGEIIFANPASEKILGLSIDQMQGRTSIDPIWKAIDKDKNDLPGEKHPAMIALQTGEKVTDFLMAVYHPSKEDYNWIIVNSIPEFKEGEEKPFQVFSTFLDVTNYINSQNDAKEAFGIINKSGIVPFTWINDEHWSVEYVAKSVEELLGHSREDLILQKIRYSDCIHPDDLGRVIEEVNKFSKKPEINEFEHEPYRIITNTKEIKWVKDWTFIIRDETGNITHYKGLIQDITEKITADIALKETQYNFQQLFTNSQNGIVICKLIKDHAGKPIDYIHLQANPSTEKHLGYKPETLVNKTAIDLIGDEKGLEYAQKNGSCVITGTPNSWIDYVPFYEKYLKMDSFHLKDDIFAITFIDISKEIIHENELKESELKYRNLIEDIVDVVFELSEDGYVQYISPKVQDVLGYFPDEVFNKNFKDFVYNDDLEKALEGFNYHKNGGQNTVEFRMVKKNGDVHWVSLLGKMVADKNQNMFRGVFRDITDRKESQLKLDQSKRETEMILNTAADGIRIVTKDSKIKLVNDTFAEMVGLSKDEVIGRNCNDVLKSDECGTGNCPMNIVLQTGEGFEKETIRKTWDNREIPCILKVTPYRDENNEIIGIIEDFRDITDISIARKQLHDAHEKLKQLNQDLESKVKDRTEKIQMLLDQKDEFINQLGHDLKNPLGPLMNLLPMIEMKEKDPKQKEMLNVINRNVAYIKNLVTKTIQLAQLKSPSTGLHYETIDLSQEVNDILKNNQLHFEEKQITVENRIPDGITIDADRLKLQEVINNLLNNAVKYNKKEGGVVINQSLDNDSITVSITDSGIGMTPEQIDKVFDEFFKADESRHDFDSSGLGMPITKRIVELHGGRIWAESEGLDKGSTFYFTLPLRKTTDLEH